MPDQRKQVAANPHCCCIQVAFPFSCEPPIGVPASAMGTLIETPAAGRRGEQAAPTLAAAEEEEGSGGLGAPIF